MQQLHSLWDQRFVGTGPMQPHPARPLRLVPLPNVLRTVLRARKGDKCSSRNSTKADAIQFVAHRPGGCVDNACLSERVNPPPPPKGIARSARLEGCMSQVERVGARCEEGLPVLDQAACGGRAMAARPCHAGFPRCSWMTDNVDRAVWVTAMRRITTADLSINHGWNCESCV
ncbi:hypothetical protein DAEQUDRAFT_415186 [Daedalea quercina L-15889]|uniref:Uncharacterized protein n=1 Tax=Daedalea quercina L-15889 TaxID=1314783 RepID=A0A165TI61_9APHY|nr:hypothetical protein DAEQUDRAFT_415186 [Daedalea quercina L-15889]